MKDKTRLRRQGWTRLGLRRPARRLPPIRRPPDDLLPAPSRRF